MYVHIYIYICRHTCKSDRTGMTRLLHLSDRLRTRRLRADMRKPQSAWRGSQEAQPQSTVGVFSRSPIDFVSLFFFGVLPIRVVKARPSRVRRRGSIHEYRQYLDGLGLHAFSICSSCPGAAGAL